MQERFDKELALLLDGNHGPLLLAVSGGIDSVCMAHLVATSSLKIPFALAHMNFSLRGKDSDGDEAFVSGLASSLKAKLHSKVVDTVAYAKQHSLSIEMAARELRYNWFESLAKEFGFTAVAVAHNANDSAETLILNLSRGTGIKGICGIKKRNGLIIRPMLIFSRAEIEAYATSNIIAWRTDSSNSDTRYIRNRIRHTILPELEKINPSILATLAGEMKHFQQADAILESIFVERSASFMNTSNNCISIDTGTLLSDPHHSFWLFKILEPLNFNEAQILQIEKCIANEAQSGRQFLSNSHKAVLSRGSLNIYSISFCPDNDTFALKIYEKPSDFNPASGLFLDAGLLGLSPGELIVPLKGRIYLRSWQAGDRFVPFGLRCSKKVSDFLTEKKLDLAQKSRERVLVLVEPDGIEKILYCHGRTDNRFRITSATTLVAEIIVR